VPGILRCECARYDCSLLSTRVKVICHKDWTGAVKIGREDLVMFLCMAELTAKKNLWVLEPGMPRNILERGQPIYRAVWASCSSCVRTLRVKVPERLAPVAIFPNTEMAISVHLLGTLRERAADCLRGAQARSLERSH